MKALKQIQSMLTRPFERYDANRAPLLSGALPVAGHTGEFVRDPMGLLYRAREEHGDACTFNLFGTYTTFLTGPDGNATVFKASDKELSPKEAYKLMTPIFGKGIAYDAEPEIMSEQLAFFTPALRRGRMETYAQHMREETENYTKDWGDEGEIDILDMTNELTMYVSSRCLLCVEFRDKLNAEFSQLYQELERGVHPIAYFFPNAPTPAFRKRDKARARMGELIGEIVAERKRTGTVHEDFLQTLMDASYKDGRKLTDDEIAGLLLAIVFAGHHTSAVLAAWTGIELLQHPQYMPAILEEQARVQGDGAISFESLKQLPKLEAAVFEAERLHPPLILILRKVLQDMKFRDYTIPAGDLVMVSPTVSNRVGEIFKDPNVYQPERFEEGREEHKISPYGMTTFGGGKHICIGMHFAHMQVKAIWSILFQNFEFELASPAYEPSFEFLVVGPKKPCKLRYKRRKVSLKDSGARQDSGRGNPAKASAFGGLRPQA